MVADISHPQQRKDIRYVQTKSGEARMSSYAQLDRLGTTSALKEKSLQKGGL